MKHIIFTKGAPGSGKSSFLAEHGVQDYALSVDAIRLLYGRHVQKIDGEFMK